MGYLLGGKDLLQEVTPSRKRRGIVGDHVVPGRREFAPRKRPCAVLNLALDLLAADRSMHLALQELLAGGAATLLDLVSSVSITPPGTSKLPVMTLSATPMIEAQ